MGMELNEKVKRQARDSYARHGNQWPDAPTGPLLSRFDALELAQAIEHELNRADELGNTKISIHMDLIDAAEFARQLRRMALVVY